MPRGKQGHKALKAEKNRKFQANLRARKRLRRQRREEQEARQTAAVAVTPSPEHVAETTASPQSAVAVETFHAPFRQGPKTDTGWAILDAADRIADYAASRDKARKLAKQLNEED